MERLLSANFGAECGLHRRARRRIFCLTCQKDCCHECRTCFHARHNTFKLYISDYHYCVRKEDLATCSATAPVVLRGVQKYICNGERVVFLRKRLNMSKRTSGNCCEVCARIVTDAKYCSLQCSVDALKRGCRQWGLSSLYKLGKRVEERLELQIPEVPVEEDDLLEAHCHTPDATPAPLECPGAPKKVRSIVHKKKKRRLISMVEL
jgi:hypothetical protein